MDWSPQQDQALKSVDGWLKDPNSSQIFRLFGYAGTGKTTLAKHFAESVEGGVNFMAFTGKAAHVLQKKGCAGATTIHSMIYHPKDKSRRKLKDLETELVALLKEPNAEQSPKVKKLRNTIQKERDNLARPMFVLNEESEIRFSKLVIIDECSMVDSQIGQDLLSFGTKVLVLGDPAQLSPVAGAGFFTNCKPDFMLTEIHRQAQDNPIIYMATKTRNQETLDLGAYGDSEIKAGKPNSDEVLAADQLIVGKNVTRRNCNARVRELNGLPARTVVSGDKIVCLRNNHDLGLLNGAIWFVEEVYGEYDDVVSMRIKSEDSGILQDVEAHIHYFQGREDELNWYEKKDAQEFDFGYALTCHKSQGSQWDDVYLFDESKIFRQDKWKWLYTALTRASEKITIVR